MRILAFLFDADGVLYYRPRRGEYLAHFLQELGLAVPDESALSASP